MPVHGKYNFIFFGILKMEYKNCAIFVTYHMI